MDEFFSFYGFYQDVINDLQDNCNYEDDTEVALLRAAKVVDSHLSLLEPATMGEPSAGSTLGLMSRDRNMADSPNELELFGYKI